MCENPTPLLDGLNGVMLSSRPASSSVGASTFATIGLRSVRSIASVPAINASGRFLLNAARIEASLVSYRANLTRILGDLRDAAPDATIVFLETYNPFSFGFQAVGLEQDTDTSSRL